MKASMWIGLAALALATPAARAQAPGPAQPATAAAGVPKAAASAPLATAGDVNLSPRRLVFEGRTRSGEVLVINRGGATAEYRIELGDLTMTPDGALVPLEKAPPAILARHHSAVGALRYSPRRISLAPGQSQVIRLLARPTEGPPAELRAHLSVAVTPPAGAGLDVAQAVRPGDRSVRVQITPVFGISIPVIIRPPGLAPAQVSIEAPHLVGAGPQTQLQFTLRRSGDRSVYGDVEVIGPGGSAAKPNGVLRGVAVYPELDQRTVSLRLAGPAGPPAPGDYRIVFRDAEVENGKVLAEAQVRAP